MPGLTTKLFPRFVSVAGVTMLSLLTIEIIFRLFFSPPQIVDLAQNAAATTLQMQKTPDALYLKTDGGLRLRPNNIATIQNHRLSNRPVVLRTNSLGYRNPELAAKERPRLLFLGDSITFADYVDEKDTFVRITQELSEDRSNPLETVNAGVGGTGLVDYLHMLTETGLSIDPDVVIVGLYLNDFQRSRSIMLINPPSRLRKSWFVHYLFHSLSAVKTSFDRRPPDSVSREELEAWHIEIQENFESLEPAGSGSDVFKGLVLQYKYDWGGAWSSGAWNRMIGVLRKMKPILDSAGVPMVVVVFPVSHQVDEKNLHDFPQRQAKKVARELQVGIVDVLPALRRERGRSSMPLFYDHCHYTPHGNRVVAREIYEFLARIGV